MRCEACSTPEATLTNCPRTASGHVWYSIGIVTGHPYIEVFKCSLCGFCKRVKIQFVEGG